VGQCKPILDEMLRTMCDTISNVGILLNMRISYVKQCCNCDEKCLSPQLLYEISFSNVMPKTNIYTGGKFLTVNLERDHLNEELYGYVQCFNLFTL
jgi:hypothetical protein